MGKENDSGNVKPGRKKRRVFKPKNQITAISSRKFEEARNDPDAVDFLKRAEAEGEQLAREGLIHR